MSEMDRLVLALGWTVFIALAAVMVVVFGAAMAVGMDGEESRQGAVYASDWVRWMDGQSEFLTITNGWRTE